MIALALVACTKPLPYEGAFDLPVAASVVDPLVGGPFEDPVGYVASAHSGQIALLALKQAIPNPTTGQIAKGTYLTDDPTSPFTRGAPLATGRDRLLTSLATWAPDAATIHVFAGDAAFGELIRVPHVVGVDADGFPVEPTPTHDDPVFTDADGSGDAPTLADVVLKAGYVTTETWTITSDGEAWTVVGSRSGRMPTKAVSGTPYVGERRVIAFTIEGDATAGDTFTVHTDGGLVAYDVGGVPTALAMSPDQGTLAAIVEGDTDQLVWIDPATGAVTTTIALPDGASPSRLAWRADGVLFVADRARAAAYAVAADGAVTELPTPWPVLDVAPLDDDDGGRWLYLAPAPLTADPDDAQRVWVLDLATGELVDTNPLVEGVQGAPVRAPITGLEAIPLAFTWPERASDGGRRTAPAAGVALGTGRLHFVEPATGCLLRDASGPRSLFVSTYSLGDYLSCAGSGGACSASSAAIDGTPRLEANAEIQSDGTQHHVVVAPCAGTAPSERWKLRYHRELDAWVVEGSVSGVQDQLAYGDRRYVSDGGEVAFTIRETASLPPDGWLIEFDVVDGALAATGDSGDNDVTLGTGEPRFSDPADPVFFHYRVGATDGAWDVVDDRAFVLVVASGEDLAARVDPHDGLTEVVWQ